MKTKKSNNLKSGHSAAIASAKMTKIELQATAATGTKKNHLLNRESVAMNGASRTTKAKLGPYNSSG